MIYQKKVLIVILFCFLAFLKQSIAQDSLFYFNKRHSASLQFIGLAFHPKGGTYPQHYHRKLDPKAYFVIELGGAAQYRYRLSKRWSTGAGFAYYSDCAAMPAGIIQLGFRWHIIAKPKHNLSLAFGPTLLFRRDWHELEGYITDAFFAESVYGRWQYRFYLVPELEYGFSVNDKWDVFYSLIPGGQHVSTSSVGARFNWR